MASPSSRPDRNEIRHDENDVRREVANDEGKIGNESVSLSPLDLARGYASLAFKVNDALGKKIPELQADLDQTKGIALAAHGIAAETRARVEDIAVAVKAAPIKTRSIPPPPLTEKLEIQYSPTPTGTHYQIEHEELERIQRKIAEKEAEERGAKEALIKLQAQEEWSEKRAERTRNKYLFVMAILVPIVGAITYVFEHFVFVVKP